MILRSAADRNLARTRIPSRVLTTKKQVLGECAFMALRTPNGGGKGSRGSSAKDSPV